MGVLLFHPSVAVFIQQVGRSLQESGQLDRFVTSVRDDPGSWSQKLVCAGARCAGKDLAPQFKRRAITEIPAEKVACHPWRELARLAVGSVDSDGRLTDLVWEWSEKGFDRAAAAHVHSGLTGVYGFEHSSLATFRRARSLGIRIAYEVPAPEPAFVRSILDSEAARVPELSTPYSRHTAARDARRNARRREEWGLADLILVNSRFTRSSYERAGFDCSKVRVAALGAPTPIPADETGPQAGGGPLNLIWAGTFSVRKGAHVVLEAWRAGRLGQCARLRVFGSVTLPERLVRPAPEGVEFCGSIPRTELLDRYRQADALLFPTLCDGFGMVVPEAWSRGLPVITTERAGAADLLKPGVNGLLIPAGDPAAITGVVAWCAGHRTELGAMRASARATAAAWQWSDYRRLHASVLRGAGLHGGIGTDERP